MRLSIWGGRLIYDLSSPQTLNRTIDPPRHPSLPYIHSLVYTMSSGQGASGQGAGDPDAAAAALLAALPPLDKMSLVAIWIETVLYGELRQHLLDPLRLIAFLRVQA